MKQGFLFFFKIRSIKGLFFHSANICYIVIMIILEFWNFLGYGFLGFFWICDITVLISQFFSRLKTLLFCWFFFFKFTITVCLLTCYGFYMTDNHSSKLYSNYRQLCIGQLQDDFPEKTAFFAPSSWFIWLGPVKLILLAKKPADSCVPLRQQLPVTISYLFCFMLYMKDSYFSFCLRSFLVRTWYSNCW